MWRKSGYQKGAFPMQRACSSDCRGSKMKKERCFHCGQAIMRHKHTLSMPLLKTLMIAVDSGKECFHLQKDLLLTHNQYANFQKLRYWNLVSMAEFAGMWKITDTCLAFL